MKAVFSKHKLIQPPQAVSERKIPHPVFLTCITADPYVGCQYACDYCYAIRKDGLLRIKTNIVGQLSKKLGDISANKKSAALPPVMVGAATDPYQEAEKEMMITKRCIEIITEREFPLQVFTKSELVLRDAGLIAAHSSKGLAAVNVTIFSLDDSLWRRFERGVPPPEVRLEVISKLKKKGVLCGLVLMPVFPFINDGISELEKIFKEGKKAGAEYVIPGCYNARGIPDKKLPLPAGKENNFNSAFGPGGAVKKEYLSALEKIFFSLSKKYDMPLGVPVSGSKGAVDLDMEPL